MEFKVDDPVAMGDNFDKYEKVEHKDQGIIKAISEEKDYAMVKFFQIEEPITVSLKDLVKLTEYHITIKASVTKTEGVFAENMDEAEELAHQQFSVLNDATPENYEQETVNAGEANT